MQQINLFVLNRLLMYAHDDIIKIKIAKSKKYLLKSIANNSQLKNVECSNKHRNFYRFFCLCLNNEIIVTFISIFDLKLTITKFNFFFRLLRKMKNQL